MQSREDHLCEAIRKRCADRQWYGPEFRGPAWGYTIPRDNPLRTGFAFPPATEEQLRETEGILGFPLPPMLRTLYSQLANGGFGPAYGIRGVKGGAPEEAGTLATWYQIRAEMLTFFDLKEAEIRPGKNFSFDASSWPRSLLALCDLGCGNSIGLDSVSGLVLSIDLLDHGFSLTSVGDSLEQWLQRWIENTL